MILIKFFDLKNIDKKLYQQAIRRYLTDHFYYLDHASKFWLNSCIINIYPTCHKLDNSEFHEGIRSGIFNCEIPHGNTGKLAVNMFIRDKKDNVISLPLVFRENMFRICHELGHLIFQIYYNRGWHTYPKSWVNEIHRIDDLGINRTCRFWHYGKLINYRVFNLFDYTHKLRQLNNKLPSDSF